MANIGITQTTKDKLTELKGQYMSYSDTIEYLIKEHHEFSALRAKGDHI